MEQDGEHIREMKLLLQRIKHAEGDDTLQNIHAIMKILGAGHDMRDYFFRSNGVGIILDCIIGADIQTLNSAFALLAVSTCGHHGNKSDLTSQRAFCIISKVLQQTKPSSITASSRALFLLSHIVDGNGHGQELANSSGCIKRLEEVFINLSSSLLNMDRPEKNVIVAWHSLSYAISACCYHPHNIQNQNGLRPIIPEATSLLNDWIKEANSKMHLQQIMCDLLTLFPVLMSDNPSNQFYFVASSGVHAVIKGLITLENIHNNPLDMTKILVKLADALHSGITGNMESIKLAGSLGAVPVIVQLLKYTQNKERRLVMVCLATLLTCQENSESFNKMGGITFLQSQLKGCDDLQIRELIEQMCNMTTLKSESKIGTNMSNRVLGSPPNSRSSPNGFTEQFSQKNFHYNPAQLYARLDMKSAGNTPLFSKLLEDDGSATDSVSMSDERSPQYHALKDKSKGPILLPHKEDYKYNERAMKLELDDKYYAHGNKNYVSSVNDKYDQASRFLKSPDDDYKKEKEVTKYPQGSFLDNDNMFQKEPRIFQRNLLPESTRPRTSSYSVKKSTDLEDIYGQQDRRSFYREVGNRARNEQFNSRRTNDHENSLENKGFVPRESRSIERNPRRGGGIFGRGGTMRRDPSRGRRTVDRGRGYTHNKFIPFHQRQMSSEMPELINAEEEQLRSEKHKPMHSDHQERSLEISKTSVSPSRDADDTPDEPPTQRTMIPFSEEEERNLVMGLKKFGLDFKAIHQEYEFQEKRTPNDLYQKWRNCYYMNEK